MTDLGGQPETPATARLPHSRHLCPECSQGFAVVHPNQMFCTPPHKKAFANRQISRGASLTPLVIAARITRGGTRGDTTTGRRARQAAEMLIARWVEEDRAAGRMSMVDYIALRLRKGFEPA
jgi:hypothetical protein